MPIARRSEAAERDLQYIAFHIAFADRRPLTADRIIDELVAEADDIARLSTNTVLGSATPG